MQGQESIEKPDRNSCNASATADQKELQVYFAISAFSSISEFHAWHVWGTESTDSSLTGGWENQVLFLCASLFLCVWIKLPWHPPSLPSRNILTFLRPTAPHMWAAGTKVCSDFVASSWAVHSSAHITHWDDDAGRERQALSMHQTRI